MTITEAQPPRGRRANVESVLDALRTWGPSSQAAIARATRLSPATVNVIVRELRDLEVVEVKAANKRESLVSLVSTTINVVVVEVAVASLHAALFSFATSSRVDERIEIPVNGREGGGDPELVEAMVRRLCAQAAVDVADLAGVAITMQGPIARASGAVISWAQLQLPGWRDIAVANHFAAALGVPVVADNDANLAALAEWTWGGGRNCADFLYVTCSAGIGGGIVLNGKIYRGGDGLAGEIGHMVLEPDGPVCFCGSRGCLTTFASERSIIETLGSTGDGITTLQDVIDRARRGDAACQRVLMEAGRHLGRALANTAKVIAPSVIAIGGTLGTARDLVFDSVRTSMEINSLHAVSPAIMFRAARIQTDATILGGLAAVLQQSGHGISELPEWAGTVRHP